MLSNSHFLSKNYCQVRTRYVCTLYSLRFSFRHILYLRFVFKKRIQLVIMLCTGSALKTRVDIICHDEALVDNPEVIGINYVCKYIMFTGAGQCHELPAPLRQYQLSRYICR